jgi:hypothetical protein
MSSYGARARSVDRYGARVRSVDPLHGITASLVKPKEDDRRRVGGQRELSGSRLYDDSLLGTAPRTPLGAEWHKLAAIFARQRHRHFFCRLTTKFTCRRPQRRRLHSISLASGGQVQHFVRPSYRLFIPSVKSSLTLGIGSRATIEAKSAARRGGCGSSLRRTAAGLGYSGR